MWLKIIPEFSSWLFGFWSVIEMKKKMLERVDSLTPSESKTPRRLFSRSTSIHSGESGSAKGLWVFIEKYLLTWTCQIPVMISHAWILVNRRKRHSTYRQGSVISAKASKIDEDTKKDQRKERLIQEERSEVGKVGIY